jgi:glutathione S-transferase
MPILSADPARPAYRVHGLNQSFFTRKVTGYLDYKGIPWLLRRSANAHPRFTAAGWPGGMPVVEEPGGGFIWDSTSVILHLDTCFPARAVLPDDPAQRFLCFLLDDVVDEWLYRTAVGSRWFHEENHRVGGWELGREMSVEVPVPGDGSYAMVGEHVRSSCPPLGVTAENVGTWIDEVLRPWLRVLGAHFAARPYFFGARPSLADFAAFGGNAAHFVNDPLCRRWTDEDGPAVVQHTHRLLEPEDQTFGAWSAPDDVPDTLIAVLADAGRLYLPWVARATVDGAAPVAFAAGPTEPVRATPFLIEARATLLGRYVASRSPRLDALLERAGIARYFADHVGQAGPIPDPVPPPRPVQNRPFPPAGA